MMAVDPHSEVEARANGGGGHSLGGWRHRRAWIEGAFKMISEEQKD
jgi:hypothetical protein